MYQWYSLYHRASAVSPWKFICYQLLQPQDAVLLGQRYSRRQDTPWWKYGTSPAFILVDQRNGQWMGL